MATSFTEAQRNSTGLLTAVERRLLIWLAQRLPSAINSDHLTGLGFISLVMVGASYALSSHFPGALWAVVIFLSLNWFGDSLDGTLARVRGHQRPRYGFMWTTSSTHSGRCSCSADWRCRVIWRR